MNVRQADQQLILAQAGASRYQIVVADDASPSVRYAAKELQRFLGEITGATFNLVGDDQPLPEHAILLGANRHLPSLVPDMDVAELGPESYALRTVGEHLIIVGDEPRGTLYGVYGLLTEYFGCRWYTPDVSHIPSLPDLALDSLDECVTPCFEYRDNQIKDAWDGPWAARNRLNGNTGSGHLLEQMGGGVEFGPGRRGHTALRLVPPQIHFERHPEYYRLHNGRRVPDEICWTSKGALQVTIEQIRQDMRRFPEASVYSVSQMDGDDLHCECPACQALAEREGSQMGPVLHFVNRVADAVRDEFPEKAIITFAYRWTRHITRTIVPRDNVIIFLCDIECCFAHPMQTCDHPGNTEFRGIIQDWAKITERLWVWTYETNFHHYMVPFPNTHIWGDNVRFFRDNHVTGLFTQDDAQNRNAEMAGLAAYVRARLLWNPALIARAEQESFLDAVYAQAEEPIGAYLDLLSAIVVDQNLHMRIYEMYPWNYLSPETLAQADALWDAAESAVADDRQRLARVQTDRLSVDYAWIEHYRWQATPDPSRIDHKRFRYLTDDPALDKHVARFLDRASEAAITSLREGRNPVRSRLARIAPRINWPFQPDAKLRPGLDVEEIGDGPVASQTVDDLSPMQISRTGRTVLRYRGYLRIPQDGIYRFEIESDCALKLNLRYIRWEELEVKVGHGGGVASEAFALMEGMHPIQLVAVVEGPCEPQWSVRYKGPGIELQRVPARVLSRRDPE